MPQKNPNVKEKGKLDFNVPSSYSVILHNDDFTPMDFVTMILEVIFLLESGEAFDLMMKVHVEGKAKVGSYSYDIASSKAQRTVNIARQYGFPLRVTIEKN